MWTLYFSYWKPGRTLDDRVYEITVSPDVNVRHLREQIAKKIRADADELQLYKIHENNPLPLKHLKTTKISLSDLGDDLCIASPVTTVFESQPAIDHLHLVVVGSYTSLVIRCWVRGRALDVPNKLEVPPRQMVVQLLRAVQEKSKHLGVSMERLELYRFSYSQQEEFYRIVQGTGLGNLLPKNLTLEAVLNDVPLNENISVVAEVVDLKEKRVPDWNAADRASKKPKVAPSSLGPSEYYDIQANMNERFLDNRTVKATRIQDESPPSPPDKNLAPFEVLYTGFGEFLDTCRAERQSQVVGGSADLRHAVEMFANEMAQVYKSESSRQSDGLIQLDRIFFNLPRAVIRPSIIRTTGTKTDGHYAYRNFYIPLFVKFANDGVGSKAIPAAQLASYYRLSVTTIDRKLINYSRFPALGITVVGPVVTFYGMLWVGSVVVFPLTSGISCVPYAAGGDDRRALHGAFIAAKKLLTQIEEGAEQLSSISSPPPPHLHHFFPDITELPSFPEATTSIKFRITDVMQSGSDGRILYRAQSTSSDLDLVIKVARSYSIDLHHFCASRGHAPTIRGFKKFPGDVVVTAMDHLKGDHLGQEGSEEFRNKMAEQLKQLVKAFHLSNYVHGDLRLPNIYCVEDTIKLLDFDWGGRVGEAFYPYQTLTSDLREGRDMNNLMITKEDDDRVLDMTLKLLECS